MSNERVNKPERVKYEEIMREKVESKDHVEFEEDYYSMTVLCYLKENRDRLLLTGQKMAHNFGNCVVIFGVQIVMLTCMLVAILTSS
mmetsp:Transcript_12164/g.20503  ORF Transcript_12164/g.20503 Transcript_12164/m.20503 type:complete len:87 (-) Transcript_12164:562-822(-)